MHAAGIVVGAGDNHGQIEVGKRNDLVAAVSGHEKPGIALIAIRERFEPPEIAVFGVVIDAGVRARGIRYPLRIDDLASLPAAPVEVKLPDFKELRRSKPQAAPGLRDI